MLPVTNLAPVVHTNNIDAQGSYFERLVRSKQPPPYDIPTAYSVDRIVTLNARLFGNYSSHGSFANAGAINGDFLVSYDCSTPCLAGDIERAINNARAKMLDQIHEEAMMAVNYHERKSALDMMSSRLFQLARFTAALKSGRVVDACKALNLSPSRYFSPKGYNPKRGWRRVTDFGDAWLEFHFGWAPLVGDIYNCIDILATSPNPNPFTVKGKAVNFHHEYYQKGGSPFFEVYSRQINGRVRAKCGVTIAVRNATTYTASRMGIVNPASVLWEVIPFSFVVDWFVNVGDFLSQWTDFIGLDINYPWYGWTMVANSEYSYHYNNPGLIGQRVNKSTLHSRRILGIPSVTLKIRPLKRLSAVRAATAISLLLQGLRGPQSK